MLYISNEDLLKEIEYKKNRIKRYEDIWPQVIQGQIPATYYSMGFHSRGIAIYSLLLGNKEESLKWFEKAAEYLEEQIKHQRSLTGSWEGESGSCTDFLHMAILYGDDKLIVKAVKKALEINENFPRKFPDAAQNYYYLQALSNIRSGNKEKTKDFIGKIDTKAHKGYEDYFNGLKECLEGLVEEDKELFLNGIYQLLQFHKRKYGKKPVTDNEFICITATVFLLLAKDRELEIKPYEINEEFRIYIPLVLFS